MKTKITLLSLFILSFISVHAQKATHKKLDKQVIAQLKTYINNKNKPKSISAVALPKDQVKQLELFHKRKKINTITAKAPPKEYIEQLKTYYNLKARTK